MTSTPLSDKLTGSHRLMAKLLASVNALSETIPGFNEGPLDKPLRHIQQISTYAALYGSPGIPIRSSITDLLTYSDHEGPTDYSQWTLSMGLTDYTSPEVWSIIEEITRQATASPSPIINWGAFRHVKGLNPLPNPTAILAGDSLNYKPGALTEELLAKVIKDCERKSREPLPPLIPFSEDQLHPRRLIPFGQFPTAMPAAGKTKAIEEYVRQFKGKHAFGDRLSIPPMSSLEYRALVNQPAPLVQLRALPPNKDPVLYPYQAFALRNLHKTKIGRPFVNTPWAMHIASTPFPEGITQYRTDPTEWPAAQVKAATFTQKDGQQNVMVLYNPRISADRLSANYAAITLTTIGLDGEPLTKDQNP